MPGCCVISKALNEWTIGSFTYWEALTPRLKMKQPWLQCPSLRGGSRDLRIANLAMPSYEDQEKWILAYMCFLLGTTTQQSDQQNLQLVQFHASGLPAFPFEPEFWPLRLQGLHISGEAGSEARGYVPAVRWGCSCKLVRNKKKGEN